MKAVLLVVAALTIAGALDARAASSSGTGLYVRGEGGVSFARDAKFRDDDPTSGNCFLLGVTAPRCTGQLDHLGTGWLFGVGVGYRLPGGIRLEVNYNHRGNYNLKGRDPAGTDFDPPVKSDAIMAGGTFDLPLVLGSIKPFVGVAIGRSRNEMKTLKWNDPTCCSGALTGGRRNSMAYQLTLGADYTVNTDWTLEFIYRYTDLGKFVKEAGPDSVGGPFNPSGITAQATGKLRFNEFIVGVRRGF